MLSYRHGFHAGNHGDVLKHLCQMMLIEKLKTKDKGFYYFDTHSGAGVYQLNSSESQKTNEFKHGIERLNGHIAEHSPVAQYLALVSNYQQFSQYPGSPEIAKAMMRPQDKIVLMEWHNQEIKQLKSNIGGKNIAIHHRDGYEGIKALTPPSLPRGLVLIDPSYEVASEYQDVVTTLSEVYKKWPSAIYAIWYPLLSDRKAKDSTFDSSSSKKGRSEAMLDELASQPFKNLLRIELRVTTQDESEGMYGSGMAVINAPWQFDKQIEACLTEISPILVKSENGDYSVDWLIQDS